MEALETLLTRRSIRAYEDRMPAQELIDKVMEAGLYAASGKNMQTAIIVEVTNKEVRKRLSVINAEIMGTTADPFYGAPVVLAVLADKSSPNYVYDGALMQPMPSVWEAAGSTVPGRLLTVQTADRCWRSGG